MPRHRRDVIIRLIALFKLLKAAMLVALGIGALSLHHDHSWPRTWIHALAADPHGRYVTELIAKVSSLDAHDLRRIGVGSLIYASVFAVEGVGLMLRKAWAEVMTVIVTTSFIPLEIYELAEHPSAAKVVVLAFNVLVVLYLLRRLKREGHWPFRRRTILGRAG
ncbi:MAG: DUF2127 domain-containing protein [Deltaproteobacteria bacterium]|nr:MAG: DUF2127 domain-containing protein [Deltaproteobacteria bacterium]